MASLIKLMVLRTNFFLASADYLLALLTRCHFAFITSANMVYARKMHPVAARRVWLRTLGAQ